MDSFILRPYFSFRAFASILGDKVVPMSEEMGQVRNENTWAMLCHLVALLGFFTSSMPLVGLVVPIGAILFVWVLKKDSDAEVNEHGRQSLNWQATVFAVLLITVVPVMTYQYWKGRNFANSLETISVKIKAAKTDPEREALMDERDKIGRVMEADIAKSPMSNPPILASAVVAFLVGVSNIVFVIWNSIRAFRGKAANYPFTIPLLATRHRRGLIRAAVKPPLS